MRKKVTRKTMWLMPCCKRHTLSVKEGLFQDDALLPRGETNEMKTKYALSLFTTMAYLYGSV